MVLTLAAWLCTAGVTRSQAQAKRWHRYSCVGLEVDLPDDWQAEDNDPWSFYKKPDGPPSPQVRTLLRTKARRELFSGL